MNLSFSETAQVGRLRYHSDNQERNNEGWLPGRGQFVLDKLIIDISVDEEKAPTTAEVELPLWKKSAKSFVYTNTGKDAAEQGQ